MNSTPGLSGSFDYSDFESVREPLTKSLLKAINKIKLPNIPFPGGNLNNNNLKVYQTNDLLIFQPIEANNSILFQITNLKVNMRVNDFEYNGAAIPIKGYLDVTMNNVLLGFKAEFKKILQNGRLLPQIEIIDGKFNIDMSKIEFNLGGGVLLSIADLILPVLLSFFEEPIINLV